ncbi:MAG TPA: hypothetical protein VN812_16000 [Candidatus Acidoferrales bacterium]|nr:hypothetical protein [Candidatus Acidoferrales bacterium]
MARAVLIVAGAVVGLLAAPRLGAAGSVAACPNPPGCAQLSVGGGTGMPGATVRVALSFTQGPNDGQPGGIDELAAVALTLRLGDGSSTPLRLTDCTLGANGLPAAIKPDASVAALNVAVENLACSTGRTHCLCPNPVSGIIPDNFVNLAIYGPNPLPTPGQGAVTIPILPNGELLTIDLMLGAGAGGTLPLHVFTQWTDADHPTDTAFLSVGDSLRVDQTCVPNAGMPPCSSAQSVSQIVTTDGTIVVAGTPTSVPSATLTATPTATATPTPTSTATATVTPTATKTPTASHTGISTATPTTSVVPTHAATATASATVTVTPRATPSETQTAPATGTPSEAPTPSGTAGTTPSPTPVACVGDCDHSGTVTVNEILTMVGISLENTPLSACLAGDADGNRLITVDEILAAVHNALNGCPGSP